MSYKDDEDELEEEKKKSDKDPAKVGISTKERVEYGLTGEGWTDDNIDAYKKARDAGANKAEMLEAVQNAGGYNDRDDVDWYRRGKQIDSNNVVKNNGSYYKNDELSTYSQKRLAAEQAADKKAEQAAQKAAKEQAARVTVPGASPLTASQTYLDFKQRQDDILNGGAVTPTKQPQGTTTTNAAKYLDDQMMGGGYGELLREFAAEAIAEERQAAAQKAAQAEKYADMERLLEEDKDAGAIRQAQEAQRRLALSLDTTDTNAAKLADDRYVAPKDYTSGRDKALKSRGENLSGYSSADGTEYDGLSGYEKAMAGRGNIGMPEFSDRQKGKVQFEGVDDDTLDYLGRVLGYAGENILAGGAQVAEGLTDKIGTDLADILYYGFQGGKEKDAAGIKRETPLDTNWSADYAKSIAERYRPTEETTEKGTAEYAQQIGNMAALALLTKGANALAGAAAPGIMGGTSTAAKVGAAIPQFAAISSAAAGQSAQQAYNAGASYYDAIHYGNLSGAVEGAVETLSGGIPGMNKGLVTEAIEKAIKATPGAATILDIMGEGFEDVIGDIIDPYLQRLTYDPTAANATVDELAATFLNSAGMAALMQGGAVAFDMVKKSGGDTSELEMFDPARSGGPAANYGTVDDAIAAAYDSAVKRAQAAALNADEVAIRPGATMAEMAAAATEKADAEKAVETAEIELAYAKHKAESGGMAQQVTSYLPNQNAAPAGTQTSTGKGTSRGSTVSRPYLNGSSVYQGGTVANEVQTGYNESRGDTNGENTNTEQFRTDVSGGNRGISELESQNNEGNAGRGILEGVHSRAIQGLRVISDQRSALNEIDIPDMGIAEELNIQRFIQILDQANASNRYGSAVDSQTAESLKGAITLAASDGSATAAVKPDGDITAVAKNFNKTNRRNVGVELAIEAVAAGGTKLDCYGIMLANTYAQAGMVPVSRTSYQYGINPAMDAIVKEDITKGKIAKEPDIYAMKLDDDYNIRNAAQYAKDAHAYTQEELDSLPLMEYEESLKYRDGLMRTSHAGGPNTVGAMESVPGSYSWLNNNYGTIPEGMEPRADRPVDVPLKTTDTDKVRTATRTLMESPVTPDELIPRFEKSVEAGLFSFKSESDRTALNKAKETVAKKGWADSMRMWQDVADGSRPATKNDIAMAALMYSEMAYQAKNAPTEELRQAASNTAMKMAAEIALEGTTAGQTVQAFQLLKRTTPEGRAYYLQKTADKIAKGRGIDINIDPALYSDLISAKDADAADAAEAKIIDNIAEQIPATWSEKANAWRYLAMLGNPKTHIRNILGNVVMASERGVKTEVEAALQSAAVKLGVKGVEKTVSFGRGTEEQRAFAAKDFDAVKDIMSQSNKYDAGSRANTDARINDARKIFDNTALEWARSKNMAALGAEDMWFKKSTYEDALARYMSAQNIDPASITTEQLDKARVHAIKEALEATFNEANGLANWLNKSKNINGAWGTVARVGVEGVIPFKNTPLNIAKEAVRYSPVGLLNSVTADVVKVKKGTMTANEMISDLSAGITGTGMAGIGFLLGSMGLLSGGADDDKEQKFDKLQGGQEYALTIGGKSYTLDWAAPGMISVFVGNEIQKALDGKYENLSADEKVGAVLDSLNKLLDPMINMTMLQGVERIFSSSRNSEVDSSLGRLLLSAVTSFAQQFVPTLSGQVARAIDPTSRNAYYNDKTDALPYFLSQPIDSIKARIPGLSQTLPARVDEWGRTQGTANTTERLAENFVSPGYYSETNSTAADKEIARLYDALGDNAVLPPTMPKYFGVNGETKNLTGKEYETFQTVAGQTALEGVTALIQSDAYKAMTDAEKQKAITDIYEYAKDMAKAAVSPEYAESENHAKNKALSDSGITAGEIAEIAAKKKALEADDTLKPQQRATEFSRWLDGQGLTDAQRDAVDGNYRFGSGSTVDPAAYDVESFKKYVDPGTLDLYADTGFSDKGQYDLYSVTKEYSKKDDRIQALMDTGLDEATAWAALNIATGKRDPTDGQQKKLDAYVAATGDDMEDAILAADAVTGLAGTNATKALAAEIIRSFPGLDVSPEEFIQFYIYA